MMKVADKIKKIIPKTQLIVTTHAVNLGKMGTTEAPHCFFHANRGKLNLSKYLKALYFRMMKELLANTTKR